ncbi:hypothetical protein JCM8547_001664 [Rhodosporidiobolus lusitaniae]
MLLLGKSLYRSLLREATRLPHPRLSEHYLQHIRSAFRRPVVPEASVQAVRRVKSAQKLLRQLQAANDGYLHSLTRAYETAYGLRGKSKHRSLEPFLSTAEPTSPTSAFPPPLAALVTSPLSHFSRPPIPSQLTAPPKLPERVNPASEEARLLGPLTLQREKAIRRRWWNTQTGKIRPPVAVDVKVGDGEATMGDEEVLSLLAEQGLDLTAMQLQRGRNLLADLEASAALPASQQPFPPRRLQTREQRATRHHPPASLPLSKQDDSARRQFKPLNVDSKWHPPKHLTPRLLRRIAQGVADKAVTVTLSLPSSSSSDSATAETSKAKAAKGQPTGPRWEVSVSEKAARSGLGRYREMNDEEKWWFEEEEKARMASSASSGRRGGKKSAAKNL